MPLVERYNDWATRDGSSDDPHTLAFDHRFGANASYFETLQMEAGFAGIQNNTEATCLITTLTSAYGWTQTNNGEWIYDPDAPTLQLRPTLGTHFNRNLSHCIQHDQRNILDALNFSPDPANVVTDNEMIKALEDMRWPADGSDSISKTSFVSRFPLSEQYIAGLEWCSGYHLGNGVVATAGHCVFPRLKNHTVSSLKVVFGWSGDVRGKRFKASEVFEIDRVLLCDAPFEYRDANNLEGVAKWARQWDNAVIKLKGHNERFQSLKKVELATLPPNFGSPVYNIGCPLGTPLKISGDAHVLRHAIFNADDSPFSYDIDAQGTFTTDLDQFPGNSGGPVFNATTGKVVGHTVSTQSAVLEATLADIEDWERKFLVDSKNYKSCQEIINPHLAQRKPGDPSYRVHPKFYRTLSGNPFGGALFLNTTFICPGDIGPNEARQPEDTCHAVFNRHRWNSHDVVFRNLTGRIDRVHIFTRPLRSIIDDYSSTNLTIRLAGPQSKFKEPDPEGRVIIMTEKSKWKILLRDCSKEVKFSSATVTYSFSLALSAEALHSEHSPDSLDTSTGLAGWAHLRFEQSFANLPNFIELELVVKRAAFPFPVDKTWPPDRPDITHDPEDRKLGWPAEEFRFSTAVGLSNEATQHDQPRPQAPTLTNKGSIYAWEAPVDRVWSLPREPSHGLETTTDLKT